MRRQLLSLFLVGCPALASSQAKPQPLVVTGATASTVGAANVNVVASKPDGGGANSAVVTARQTIESIRRFCTLVPNDGKLFAACDNTTPEARIGTPTGLPQRRTEWEAFARRLHDADRLVNGKPRAIAVLNLGAVMAEVSSGGIVTLAK